MNPRAFKNIVEFSRLTPTCRLSHAAKSTHNPQIGASATLKISEIFADAKKNCTFLKDLFRRYNDSGICYRFCLNGCSFIDNSSIVI
jgi:hypothetical protein